MSDLFSERRERLCELMVHNSVAIVPAALEQTKNSDVHYRYRQDSSFYYLTGFKEPDSILVLCPSHSEFKSAIFLRKKDPKMEQWTGRRLGVDDAPSKLGIERAFDINELSQILPQILVNKRAVYYDIFADSPYTSKLTKAMHASHKLGRHTTGPEQAYHIDSVLGVMRLIKRDQEKQYLRKSCEINARAHKAAMAFCAPGKNEYEIHALMNYIYQKNGAWGEAYGSIVAGGDNANILHYVENNAVLKEGDLLLIDAGPEFELFASDVTRTFPVNGKFTDAQKRVYETILKVQKECMQLVKPGQSIANLHEFTIKGLTQGLLDLGVLKGSLEENIEQKKYFEWFPHGTGHWLGMDVHDIGPYQCDELKGPRAFTEGMCFTIEPGLYFPKGCSKTHGVPAEFEGIGIRIEDDILVTQNGFENLTQDIPKEIAEIERACQQDYRIYLD